MVSVVGEREGRGRGGGGGGSGELGTVDFGFRSTTFQSVDGYHGFC